VTRIYLVRHGSTPWGEDQNRYTGISDIPLSATGARQARHTARYLSTLPIAAVVASPLVRAQDTAREIAARHDLDILTEPRLREIDFGRWEGMRKATIIAQYPDEWQAWTRDPGSTQPGLTGESAAHAVERSTTALDDIASRFGDQSVIVVGHNTLIRLLIVASLAAPLASYRNLELHNCGVSLLEIDAAHTWRWHNINAVAYLEE
jgi:broad specificity phosphatase PhoE